MTSINKPLVSVVMPAYNAEKYIEEAINSVLNQTYKNFELLIIDDCSKDNTLEIIKGLEANNECIIVYKNESNSGVAETRNFGVSKARGQWIAFLDSDDIWKETKLEKQMNAIENNPNIQFSFTGSSFIDEDGHLYSYSLRVPNVITYKDLLKQNLISCSSVLIKKEFMQKIKMVNEDFHEDFYVWLKVLKETNAYGIDEPLLIYRLGKDSKSGNKCKAAIMNYRVYRRMGLNIFQTIYYMCFYVIRRLKKYKNIYSSYSFFMR